MSKTAYPHSQYLSSFYNTKPQFLAGYTASQEKKLNVSASLITKYGHQTTKFWLKRYKQKGHVTVFRGRDGIGWGWGRE